MLQDIVDAHASRPITGKNFSKLISVVYNHISYLHCEQQYEYIVAFTTAIRPLVPQSTELAHYCNITMYLIDALFRVNKVEDSFNISRELLEVSSTTQALLLLYKAALSYIPNSLDAVELIIARLDPDPTTSLTQILLCVQVTRELAPGKHTVFDRLLTEYLRRYAQGNMWDSTSVQSYQKILCSLIHESILDCSILTPSSENDSIVVANKRVGDDIDSGGVKKLRLDMADIEGQSSLEKETASVLEIEKDNEDRKFSPPPIVHAKATEVRVEETVASFILSASSIDLDIVKTRILNPLCNFLQLAENRRPTFHNDHAQENKWLADVAWNLGTLLMENSSSIQSDCALLLSHWGLAAEFFEAAQQIYGFVDTVGSGSLALSSAADNMRVQCLLTAASLRVDIHNMYESCDFSSAMHNHEGHVKYMPERSKNIAIACENLESASVLTTPSHPQLLTLRLAYYCSTSVPDMFISDNTQGFLQMSLSQIERCADTILSEQVPPAICRQFLHIVIQRAFQDTIPCYHTIGKYYSKLINLSSTRNEALQKVEEFEQLVGKDLEFNAEDINYICCMCYNWGITLIQLDQITLAEKFISKALNLYHYTSQEFAIWNETIQVEIVRYAFESISYFIGSVFANLKIEIEV